MAGGANWRALKGTLREEDSELVDWWCDDSEWSEKREQTKRGVRS